MKVALTFVLFHQRLCGPLANSLFHHQPDPASRPKSKLETAFHKADDSIRKIIQLLEAALSVEVFLFKIQNVRI